MTTYFEALNVHGDPTARQVRTAYMALAKEYHPDVNPGAAERFKLITAAFNALKTDEAIETYRRHLRWDMVSKADKTWARDWDALNGHRHESPKAERQHSAKPGACGHPTKSGPCCRPAGHTSNGHMSKAVSDRKAANYKARKAQR